jgi:hypothetical protein
MAIGDYGKTKNGKKSTGDKQHKNSAGYLTAENFSIKFHGINFYQ